MTYRLLIASTFLAVFALHSGASPGRSPGYLGVDVDSLLEHAGNDEAERFARELLAREESSHGRESMQAADALDLLVRVLVNVGKAGAREALELAERAVATRAALAGTADPGYGLSEVLLGYVHEKAGSRDDARLHYETGVAAFERAGATDDLRYAYGLLRLGRFLRTRGELPRARDLYARSVEVHLEAGGEEYRWTVEAMWGYAVVLRKMGDYEGSARTLRHAIDIRKRIFGDNSPQVTGLESSLAHVLRKTGKRIEARRLYEHVLAVEEKAFGPDDPRLNIALNGLANLLFLMGDMDESARYYRRAIEVCRKGYGPEHPETLTGMYNLASIYWKQGNYREALDIYNEVMEAYLRVLGPDNSTVAKLHSNLGGLYRVMGDFDSAEYHLNRALELFSRLLGDDHPNIASALDELGQVAIATGRLDQAGERLARSLAIREGAFGEVHPDVAQTLFSIALLEAARNDTVRAVDAALCADSVLRRYHRSVLRGMAESDALAFENYRPRGLRYAIAFAVGLGDTERVENVWDELIRSRSMIFDEMARRHRAVFETDDPKVVTCRDSLAAASERLAKIVVRGPGEESAAAFRESVAVAERGKARRERELAEVSERFRAVLDDERCGFEEVAGSVAKNEALVAYVLNEITDRPDGVEHIPSEDEYVAFVLPAGGGDASAVRIGRVAVIDSLIFRWRRAVRHDRTTAAAGKALRRAIWDPVAARIGDGATLVHVVPDGAIHLVDLYALPAEGGGYLVERGPEIRYISAERDIRRGGTPAGHAGEGLLALGGPDFDLSENAVAQPGTKADGWAGAAPYRGATTGCDAFESVLFEPLPGARREAVEVAAIWKEGAEGGGENVVLLDGAAASEEAFKEDAAGRRVLHLATHAFFLGEECSGKSGGRGIGGAVVVNEEEEKVPQSPLLLSGLALAGANRRAEVDPATGEDGILTAEEIAALDLSNVEWAVLSACGTGLGEVRAGEGIFGLRRAFRIAGVKSLLLSLWDVDDETTGDWMRIFYRKLTTSDRDLSDAARATSLELLRARRAAGQDDHPLHWAGFVATGD